MALNVMVSIHHYQVSVVCAQPDLPHYYIPFTDLKNVTELCEGGTSMIYTADYHGQSAIAKVRHSMTGESLLVCSR